MNRELTYNEPIKFSNLSSNQQKSEQQFDMTCSCGKIFSVPIDIVGTSAPCPKCGNYVLISSENFMPFTCGCGKSLRIPRAGGAKKCPACRKPIKLLIMPSAQIQPEKPSCETPVNINTGKIEQPVEKAEPQTDAAAQKAEKTHVKVKCSCGAKLAVRIKTSHESIECPQCHNNFKLSKKHFLRVTCVCGTEFKVLRMLEGQDCKCPQCGQLQKAVKALNLKPVS